jgi:hypothetical protein
MTETIDPHPWYGPCDALAEQLRAELDRLYDDHRRAYARVDEIEAKMGEVRARMSALGVHDVI